jgi:secretion/DNA translocation related CpaE-like protein
MVCRSLPPAAAGNRPGLDRGTGRFAADGTERKAAMTPASVIPITKPPSGGPAGRPLIVTEDPGLLDDLVQLADAAQVIPTTVADPLLARPYWTDAPLAVVGADRLSACLEAGLPRRARVVVAGGSVDDPGLWDDAARLGAEHVVILPAARAWLIEVFASAVPADAPSAVVVGVVGGQGGAGASTLATALAVAGARAGLRTVLVDADPFGGGLDLALGRPAGSAQSPADAVPEPPDQPFDSPPGERPGERPGESPRDPLREPLGDVRPSERQIVALAWDRSGPDQIAPEAMATLLARVRRSSDLVVVDLPRHPDPAATVAIRMSSTLLLLVPATARAAAAADRVCARARLGCDDIRVVVRGSSAGRASPRDIAESLAAPLAGLLPEDSRLASTVERGQPPGFRPNSPLAQLSRALIADLLPPHGARA